MARVAGPFENSASFMRGVAEAVREVGAWDALERALGAETFGVLKNPHARRWWPGGLLLEIAVALDGVGGADMVERVGFLATKSGIAPVARRLVQVTFALAGSSPETIFSRATVFGATALRGVDLTWTKLGDGAGEMLVSYPVVVPRAAPPMWVGTFEFVFELTEQAGAAGPVRHDGGTSFTVPAAWAVKR